MSPRVLIATIVVVAIVVGGLQLASHGPGTGSGPLSGGGTATASAPRRATPKAAPPAYASVLAPAAERVAVRFRHAPRAGLLFDLHTGKVLWQRAPTRRLKIASLTKMMTAILVADRVGARAKARITKEVLAYQGSGVGVLPKHKRVQVETLLYGLLLPSGNDAAIALALKTSGTVPRFVRLMNRERAKLGLRCSRFASPSGFVDAGNYACAQDLALLSKEMLHRKRLARIVRTKAAIRPLPIKGGKVYLFNNNPLLRQNYPGTIGLKTGYTDLAGRCLVAAARRRGRTLGVVLLHSPDPGRQAIQLLNRGFRTPSANAPG